MALPRLVNALRTVVTLVVAALSCIALCAPNFDGLARLAQGSAKPNANPVTATGGPAREPVSEPRTQDFRDFGEEGELPASASSNLTKATAASRRRLLPPLLPSPLVVLVAPVVAFVPPQAPEVQPYVLPSAARVHIALRRFLV